MSKRVVVQMSEECHKALKQYAAFYGMTMSEVLYESTRMQFHTQLGVCEFVEDMFEKLGIEADNRASKPCFSFMCFSCKHRAACKEGTYQGVIELEGPCIDKNLVLENGRKRVAALQIEAGQEPQFEDLFDPDSPACRHQNRCVRA
tara:strand:+ start:6597 stop:7034 length:438 start_codon:yes stop_codon:yes gene_type:complete